MKKLFVLFWVWMALLPQNIFAQSSSADDVDIKYAVDLPKAGSEAPDFKLKTMEGKTLSLSQYRGKYCVLDFWASWCGDCRRDMPEMKRIYDQFSKQGVQFVGISFDTRKEAWQNGAEAPPLERQRRAEDGGGHGASQRHPRQPRQCQEYVEAGVRRLGRSRPR